MKRFAPLVLAALASATAAQAQAPRTWMVETPRDGDAWLRYGTPETDDQPLAMSCVRKSGQVGVMASVDRPLAERMTNAGVWVDKAGVPAPWPVSVTVASGATSVTLRGKAHPDEVTSGTLVMSEFSTRAPVTDAFRKSGLVEVQALSGSVRPPPAPKGMVRRFLGACK
ncbi:MAG: hypothetical protein ACK41C_09925 [Phenylobacterium sp.]|uniref:hypothetical protein n=1 Tax=Phenylobacterium sp. TaxID=1871053 RepID=UPI003918DDB4